MDGLPIAVPCLADELAAICGCFGFEGALPPQGPEDDYYAPPNSSFSSSFSLLDDLGKFKHPLRVLCVACLCLSVLSAELSSRQHLSPSPPVSSRGAFFHCPSGPHSAFGGQAACLWRPGTLGRSVGSLGCTPHRVCRVSLWRHLSFYRQQSFGLSSSNRPGRSSLPQQDSLDDGLSGDDEYDYAQGQQSDEAEGHSPASGEHAARLRSISITSTGFVAAGRALGLVVPRRTYSCANFRSPAAPVRTLGSHGTRSVRYGAHWLSLGGDCVMTEG